MSGAAGRHVVIVGAGLGGALVACELAAQGYRVSVYERRPDPRGAGFIGGRSINLALSARGIAALQRVGLAERVLKDAVPMRGRMMHDPAGGLVYQAYSKEPKEAINSVSRGGLNLTLLEAAAAHDGVTLHFDHRCTDLDLEGATALFETGGREVRVEADLIIGADGAFSAVRGHLQRTDRFDYSQSYLEHGYKELHIPPTAAGEFAMEPHALHIWPRGGFMMIALPNQDRSFTCTLFWPFRGARSFESIPDRDAVLPFFEKWFGDAVPLMPTLVEDYQRNPVSSLVTVRCWPWVYADRVALLGDAAHAIVPFYGQGMNAAFEDCTALARCLEAHGHEFAPALADYQQERKQNADAIADMALDNFVEMRDHVASPVFRARKRFERLLHRMIPDQFVPLYNMVSFSTIPYAEARRRAARQWTRVMQGLVAALVLLLLLVLILILLLT
ncbi:MAG: FAD-dependent monooxygenase [Phycisphaerales bacterium]|nr:FAD-dependent monooxygenase [Phycisphaerales bacterium]